MTLSFNICFYETNFLILSIAHKFKVVLAGSLVWSVIKLGGSSLGSCDQDVMQHFVHGNSTRITLWS
jgi:hypothetical protein